MTEFCPRYDHSFPLNQENIQPYVHWSYIQELYVQGSKARFKRLISHVPNLKRELNAYMWSATFESIKFDCLN